MSRSWILSLAIVVLLGSAPVLTSPALGQVPTAHLAVSVRADGPYNWCGDAPPACLGAGWVSTTGRMEFDVYLVPGGDYPADAARFCLTWPDAWEYVSSEICFGALVSGDPGIAESPLEFAFPECPYTETPFLRIVMDCPTPGSFSLACSPTVRVCGGGDWWIEENIGTRADVGDWCGRLPNHPCDWCSMFYRRAAGFDPPNLEVTLPPGQVWSGLLHAWGDLGPECGGAPECGEGYGACFGGLETDVPWMSPTVLWPPDDGHQYVPYMLRVDSYGLAPGRYEGSVVSQPGCGWCRPNCMPVALNVLEPAAVDAPSPAQAVRLDGPYPNPAADRLQYAISLAAPSRARVAIFDVAGRRVADLLDRDMAAGSHDLTWIVPQDALPSGSYILRLETGAVRQSRLIVLAR
jgi:hypothetical protein